MKKIFFVLPGYSRRPIGGYKIIYQYANKLAEDGYKVNIVYLEYNRFPKFSLKWLVLKYWTQNGPSWLKLNRRIKKYTVNSNLSTIEYNKDDVVIASSVETVEPTKRLFADINNKFYFIQDLEDWNVSRDYLISTYNMGFTNIAISKWLKEFVDKHSKRKTIYLRNPIDIKKYHVINLITNRDPYTIGMLYHKASYKGSDCTLDTIKQLKSEYPKLKLIMFGTRETPKNLPNWIKYYKNASQATTINIYNSIGIFVCGTIKEGFGLTGLEAMACGAALVSTDYLGAREYALNGVNSILSPVTDYKKLGENIRLLIDNPELRLQLAKNGVKTVADFSWNVAYKRFKSIIFK